MEADSSSHSMETPQWRHADRRGLSYNETHRVKQRESYRAMKSSLTSLENILPNLQSTSRTFRCKTKQTILTEAKVYIEYLQSLIWKIGKELEKPDETLISYLLWDGCVLNNATMTLLHKITPLHPRYFKQPCMLEDIANIERQVAELQHQEKGCKIRSKIDVSKTKRGKGKRSNKSKNEGTLKVRIQRKAKKKNPEEKKLITEKKQDLPVDSNLQKQEDKNDKAKLVEDRKLSDELQHKLKSPPHFEIQSPPIGYRRTSIEDSPLQDVVFAKAGVVSPMPWLPQIQEEIDEIFQCEPLDLSSPFRIDIDHPLDLSTRRSDEDLYLDFSDAQDQQSPIDLSQSCSVWASPHHEMTQIITGSSGSIMQSHRISDACLSSTVICKDLDSVRQPSHFLSRF